MAINFPDEWTGVRYNNCKWNAGKGGLPIKSNKNGVYTDNPQFFIECAEDTGLFVSLGQDDGRLKFQDKAMEVDDENVFESDKGYKFDKYPFKNRLVSAQLSIFKLPKKQKEDYLLKYDKNQAIHFGKIMQTADNSARVKLEKGERYVIVPSPKEPTKKDEEFYLSLYFSCEALHKIRIERVGQGAFDLDPKSYRCKLLLSHNRAKIV